MSTEPLVNPVAMLEIDETWHPSWHALTTERCGFELANVAYPLVNGMYSIGKLAFAAFPRPVGGTHQRSACQLCGGSAGPAHSYERVFGGDMACATCIIKGNHMGIPRWGRP